MRINDKSYKEAKSPQASTVRQSNDGCINGNSNDAMKLA